MDITREQLLTPVEVSKEKVEIPELGGHIWIKGMTAAGRSRFERQFQSATGKSSVRKISEIRERLVIACACDENGKSLFTEEDIKSLGKQSIGIIERIVNAAQRICIMTDEDVEALAKNSEEVDEIS